MNSLRVFLAFPEFFLLWLRSHTNLDIYPYAWRLRWPFTIGFLLTLYFCLSLVRTTLLAVRTIPVAERFLQDTWTWAESSWPENQTVTYQGGAVSLSPAANHTIAYPEFWKDTLHLDQLPQNLATVNLASDSGIPATPAAVTTSLFTIYPYSFMVSTQDSRTETLSWDELFSLNEGGVQEFTLEKQTFSDMGPLKDATVDAFLKTWIIAAFFLGWIGVLVARALVLVLYAWLAQGLFSLTGNRFTYLQSYHIGLHLFPVTETVLILWQVFYPKTSPIIGFWFIWTLFATLLTMLYRNGTLKMGRAGIAPFKL